MNLNGKIAIDPILGLPGEHAELFLIGFYITLEIVPEEKVIYNRGSGSWEMSSWEMSQLGAALRQSPVTLPPRLDHVGDADAGSQHPGRLA